MDMNKTKRVECNRCLRAQRACVCHCIPLVENSLEIAILQHPSERKQVKGTARLAALGLANCHLWVGEQIDSAALEVFNRNICDAHPFGENSFREWLTQKPTYLLYPETDDPNSAVFAASELRKRYQSSECQVLLLDGTWKKTHKLLMLNPLLQSLPRVTICPQKSSKYVIRKQKNDSSLSTIEAISELFDAFGEARSNSEALMQGFRFMQEQLLSLRRESNRS